MILIKVIKEVSRKMFGTHVVKELILLKCPYHLKWPINSIHSKYLSSLQKQKNIKTCMNHKDPKFV